MRYANMYSNDFAAAPGISVTFFVQGCPHRCKNCYNPETWDFQGGQEFTPKTLEKIITDLTANGIQRNLCIMGGEPLCDENVFLTYLIINEVKEKLPDTKVYVWTGYLYENLLQRKHPQVLGVLNLADVLIDGPYIDEERDISLFMRGSRNQKIIDLKEKK